MTVKVKIVNEGAEGSLVMAASVNPETLQRDYRPEYELVVEAGQSVEIEVDRHTSFVVSELGRS